LRSRVGQEHKLSLFLILEAKVLEITSCLYSKFLVNLDLWVYIFQIKEKYAPARIRTRDFPNWTSCALFSRWTRPAVTTNVIINVTWQ
jgi:hypothetical protein